MVHLQESPLVHNPASILRLRPEWVISKKAASWMIEYFPDRVSRRAVELFRGDNRGEICREIETLAKTSKKCRELNSIAALTAPVDTLTGFHKVTFYHVGDIVFVTTPARYDGQKFVSAIFSLTEKLGRIEETRRAAEKSARVKDPFRSAKALRRKGRKQHSLWGRS